jgi:hypothetical protein
LASINRITHVTVDGMFYIYLLLSVIFKFFYDLMCCDAVPGLGLNRANPHSCSKLTSDCLFGVSARRPHAGFDCFSTRLQALSLFILVVLVLIAESNLILHAPQHYNSLAYIKIWSLLFTIFYRQRDHLLIKP